MASVAIIDYGMGNVASVLKALNFLKVEAKITADEAELAAARYLILPGVGSYRQGMENLKTSGLKEHLNHLVLHEQKPIMGICLGMQLLASRGTEHGDSEGLNWIPGEVLRIEESNKRVPHLGWNNITSRQQGIWSGADQQDFYFIHSYHFKADRTEDIAATVQYGNEYVAAVQRNNIHGTQFHPEKSQQAGLDLMKRFLEHYA